MNKTKVYVITAALVFSLATLACSVCFAPRGSPTPVALEATAAMEPTETPGSEPDQPPLPEPTAVETMEPTSTPTETIVPTSTPTEKPAFEIGSTMVNPLDGAVQVYVPKGEFLMGSEDADALDNEKPEHRIFLDAYWIYQHPVTNAQFGAFVNARGHQSTTEQAGWGWVYDGSEWLKQDGAYWGAPEGPGSSIADRGDHPVVQVSWFDAVAYCEWAGGRLPTEAEWEKAARGTDGRKYPWGNEPVTGDKANYCDVNCGLDWLDADQDDGYERTSPVGSYPDGASPYNALDMAGNVKEWVADWYGEDFFSRSPFENPTGPKISRFRVTRGGSWLSTELFLRVSCRTRKNPGEGDFTLGFRCLRSP